MMARKPGDSANMIFVLVRGTTIAEYLREPVRGGRAWLWWPRARPIQQQPRSLRLDHEGISLAAATERHRTSRIPACCLAKRVFSDSCSRAVPVPPSVNSISLPAHRTP